MLQGFVHIPVNEIHFSKHGIIAAMLFYSVMSEEHHHLLLEVLHFVNDEIFNEKPKTRRLLNMNLFAFHKSKYRLMP
jgi:hypothetical protein